ncbi:MAG TPA: tRNA (N6-isopentenyl adenosine(37)-C2)-methylthiotransferase MiaB [bacterium]|nr:tRNA (N6-isopentenyl adenosine(37)-C2)-methylthiotransferase MiaB [bacterium]
MRGFHIHTFGCQMNEYDSERVAGLLVARGWHTVASPEEADLLIINTCSVREKPLQKVFSYAGRFIPARKDRSLRIFVMGCVAQQLGTEMLERAPYIDGVFGPGHESMIPDAAEGSTFPVVLNEPTALAERELFPSQYDTLWKGSFSAPVTVMHGCDNYCSYCIVPYVRGTEVSRSADEILREIGALATRGIREVTLLGQNVNSYRDPDNGLDFSGLLYLVAERSGLSRIRFVTSHPRDFTRSLAETFSRIPTLMPYLHLPAQAGSDRILALMNRGYTTAQYLEKIALARETCPDISLSGDFIVGFPGETADEFAATISLIEAVRYDTLFAFVYSPRPGTKAAAFPETLTEVEKLDRLNHLLTMQRMIMGKTRKRFLGRNVTVLVESPSPRGDTVMGRSEHNQIVHIAGAGQTDIGSFVPVRVTEILENTLRGIRI